jgi:hypothetical protein
LPSLRSADSVIAMCGYPDHAMRRGVLCLAAVVCALVLVGCGSGVATSVGSKWPAPKPTCSRPLPSDEIAATTSHGVSLIKNGDEVSVVPGTKNAYASAIAMSRDRCDVAFATDEAQATDATGDNIYVWRVGESASHPVPQSGSASAPISLSWSPDDKKLVAIAEAETAGQEQSVIRTYDVESEAVHDVATLRSSERADRLVWLDPTTLVVTVGDLSQGFGDTVWAYSLHGTRRPLITADDIGVAVIDGDTLAWDPSTQMFLLSAYKAKADIHQEGNSLFLVPRDKASLTLVEGSDGADDGVFGVDARQIAFLNGSPSTPHHFVVSDNGNAQTLGLKPSDGFSVAWGM